MGGVPQYYYVDAFADEGIMLEGIAGPPDQAAMATPAAARSTASGCCARAHRVRSG